MDTCNLTLIEIENTNNNDLKDERKYCYRTKQIVFFEFEQKG